MPVIISKEGTDYYLIPAPLVSVSRQTFNNVGRPSFGADYSISLEGTLVPEKGNPFFNMNTGGPAHLATSADSWTTPSGPTDASEEPNYGWSEAELLAATIRKQEMIRSLFSNDVISGVARPLQVNITNWGQTTSGIKFAAFVDDISFDSASRGVNAGSYSISLRTSNFLESANSDFSSYTDELNASYEVSAVTESLSIAEDDRTIINFQGQGVDTTLHSTDKIYNITKNMTVVGAPVYDADGNYVSGMAPWQQASGYVMDYLGLGTGAFPSGGTAHDIIKEIGPTGYQLGNRVINEDIDKEAGSYTLNETFLLYSGEPVIHTMTINTDVGLDERRQVAIQGTIEGIDTTDPFGKTRNKYSNASGFAQSFNQNFNSGIRSAEYIIPSAYFYAKSFASLSWLNPIPQSKSLGRDIAGGSISYSYNFDDRPPNLVSGSVIETISINDTYPGELFSATPVIGRNQPILQYLNSRSEYKRSLSIQITMGEDSNNWSYSDATGGYWAGATRNNVQQWLIGNKPSNIGVCSGDLTMIFEAANPVNDSTITIRNGKCFHSAPNETWDPYSKSYSYSIEWTYEREN